MSTFMLKTVAASRVRVGQFIGVDGADQLMEVAEMEALIKPEGFIRFRLLRNGLMFVNREIQKDTTVYVGVPTEDDKKPVQLGSVIELPLTGHVFVRESIRCFTPLESHGFGDFVFSIVGVGFSVPVATNIKLDYPSIRAASLPDEYSANIDRHLALAGEAWYKECRALVFGTT